MGSNSLPVDPITATFATATNTTPATSAAMTGAHAPPEAAAAADRDQGAAAAPRASTSCSLHWRTSPTVSAPSASSSRRSKPASTRRPHSPPPPAAVPALSATPTPPASVANKGRPAWWPPSPSPIPTWTDASPVYTQTAARTTVQQPAHTFGGPGGLAAPFAESTCFTPGRQEGAYGVTPLAQQPPRFTKLEFATYDGATDPLNWLNQCEQFFRGQRTLSADRRWIASYHLRGAAQTWYYALEQDEGGMPSWERFRDLCLQRFGPTLRGSRVAELGRLAFTTTVQDFADRFQALACHAPGVSARQRADLFVGGLPGYIRVDVEMRESKDL
ncbi:uncharacterized protein [Lolium perenne]|uniref:uncharacterized protein n=1 Tax=Lolium perenne TaxID=4522 RepID=UPI003A9A5FAA